MRNDRSFTASVRQEWISFRSRGRFVALAAVVTLTVLLGLVYAFVNRSTCSEGNVVVTCASDPVGPQGEAVTDHFSFGHRSLTGDGVLTVRMTSMTGIITYPPPRHDKIVPGLVPWAKAGIMIKDGLTPGSRYAAIMVTGHNGVRMQSDYVHDTPGSPGGVSAQAPRWLRLARSGDSITGFESADGTHWTQVATAGLTGLPKTVQIGLFATSPGDLTLEPTGLGASRSKVRFTQATATFDNVTLTGAAGEAWRGDVVGGGDRTEWERDHQAPGLVTANGLFTVTGSGDVGPMGTQHGYDIEDTLIGLAIALIIVLIVAARFVARPATAPLDGRALAAKIVVLGGATFSTGLVTVGVALPAGAAALRAFGSYVRPVSTLTEIRIIVCLAGVIAVAAVLAAALGALFRRAWPASLIANAAIVVPAVLATSPLLPDTVAAWLLRLTPAAGFAVEQSRPEFAQVIGHYTPSVGYFPLPGWAGFAVLGGYTAALLGFAFLRLRRRSSPEPRWR
ncbi:hypothetical protein [Amycolatopsis pigmentata]|uniref:DUF1349 domain-containing protein n=1 Tax=Amycolatopsis pigmentata TaxID=450801 RepID=A0ABW5G6L6_9PSEU